MKTKKSTKCSLAKFQRIKILIFTQFGDNWKFVTQPPFILFKPQPPSALFKKEEQPPHPV